MPLGLFIACNNAGADPGFLERGFVCISKGMGGCALPILSHFS